MNWKVVLTGCAGFALASWVVGASVAQAALADPVTHYLCYKPKVDKLFPNHGDAPISVVCDQFACDNNDGKPIKAKPKLFCNPATKNTGTFPGPLPRPNDHLKCYKYKRKFPAPIHVQVSNQFGLEQLFLQKTKMFCVPTEKTVIP